MQTGVLLLAGGRSRRMGTNKALIPVDGRPLITRVASAVRHIGPTYVVGGATDVVVAACDESRGQNTVHHIPDPEADIGPFAAVVHAIQQVSFEELLVFSCDLARLSSQEVDLLVAARRSSDADFAVPLAGGERQWHSLSFATRSTPALVSAHRSGIRSLRRGFSGLRECAFVSEAPGFCFDVDTPADLHQVESEISESEVR